MTLTKIASSQAAVKQAADALLDALKGGGALFVSGGSSFKVFVRLDELLSDEQKKQINLYQADERYGPAEHEDSNWRLMSEIDLTKYMTVIPILTSGMSADTEARLYDVMVKNLLQGHDKTVALLGLGEDGHVAGIKPMDGSQFRGIFSKKFFAEYKWTDFHRLTLTPQALARFDKLFVYSEGEAKRAVIESLEVDCSEHSSPIHGLLSHKKLEIYYAEG